MSVWSARAQRLYSFHPRGLWGRFIRLAGWGLGLEVEAEGSFQNLIPSRLSLNSRCHLQYLEHLEHLLCRMDWNRTRSCRNPACGPSIRAGAKHYLHIFSNIVVVKKFEKNT